MYRSKSFLFLGICLLLAGCSTQTDTTETEAGLLTEVITDNSSKYVTKTQTMTAQLGDITTPYTGSAELTYAGSTDITFNSEGADVYFSKFLVQAGDYVSEGAPLAELYVSVDQIDYQEKELYLARLKNTFERKCSEYEEDIAAYNAGGSASDLVRAEELQNEYDNYVSETEKEIESTEKWLSDCEAAMESSTVTVNAPYDCYVSSLGSYYEWQSLSSGDAIMTVEPTSVWYYSIEDDNGLLKAGMKLELSSGSFKATGTVGYNLGITTVETSQDDWGWGGDRETTTTSKYAVVQIDGDYELSDLPQKLEVSGTLITIKNVVLIPEACLNQENGNYYVYVVKGDSREKVYFHCPYYKSGKCWAIDGVQAGDELVVN